MRETTLILIDGLPGSGKSTTARALTERLRQRGVAAECILESAEAGEEHALNVGGPLHPAGSTPGAPFFAGYTAESYVEESLRRWRAFVDGAARAETVWVVESYPYQNAARILLQLDVAEERIQEYAAALERLLAPLQPVLLYFDHPDAAEALRAIAAQRGPAWEAYAVDLITDCPYAHRRRLHGPAGALAVMEAYKALLDALRFRSQLPVLVLAECAGRWDVCYQQILDFLAMQGDMPSVC